MQTVDNEEVSMEPIDKLNQPWFVHDPAGVKKPYGHVIEKEVARFYNFYNREDNVYQFVYPLFEYADNALGLTGKQQKNLDPQKEDIPTPLNYLDVDVQSEINITNDADGNKKDDLGMPSPYGLDP